MQPLDACAIHGTSVSNPVSGGPRQVRLRTLNSRSSMFPWLVPGARGLTWMVRLVSVAKRWRSVFHNRTRYRWFPAPWDIGFGPGRSPAHGWMRRCMGRCRGRCPGSRGGGRVGPRRSGSQCSGMAHRSGCWVRPSRVLRGAWRPRPAPCRRRPTVEGFTGWPGCWRAAANWAPLLHVYRNGDSGSPRVVGSTRASNASRSVGSSTVKALRPPPGRRGRPAGWMVHVGRAAANRRPVDPGDLRDHPMPPV